MIVITGATGQLGGAIAERLLARVSPDEVGVSVRDPKKAQHLADRGVRVRRGDYTDPDSLTGAFDGASQVLLVSASTTGDEAVRQHRSAIDAAKAVGAQRILYTSHMGSRPDSPFAPMADHAATEEELVASGVSYTSLRHGFYASSAVQLLGNAAETGVLAAPEDGPVSWTAHADLADAAVAALTGDELDGITAGLTADEAIDMDGIATLAAEITGTPIRRVVVPDDEYRAALLERGVPEPATRMLVGLFAASRRGDFAAIDPTLPRLIGRRPTRMRDVLGDVLGPTAAAGRGEATG